MLIPVKSTQRSKKSNSIHNSASSTSLLTPAYPTIEYNANEAKTFIHIIKFQFVSNS